jgi:hypothetical protein
VELGLRGLAYAMLPTICSTELEKNEMVGASQLFLSEAYVKRIKENLMVIGRGIDVDGVLNISKNVSKYERFTCFYGARLTPQKRIDRVMEIFSRFYEIGYDVDILIVTSSDRILKIGKMRVIGRNIEEMLRRNKGIKLEFEVTKKDYIGKCARSHVWLSSSMYEGFTVGHIEMALTGTIGVVPRRAWSEEIFGKDYMFMYDRENEALGMLKYIYENYRKANEYYVGVKERIEKWARNISGVGMKVIEIMGNELERISNKMGISEDVRYTLESVCKKLGDEFDMYEFMGEFRGMLRVKDLNVYSLPTSWEIRHWLMSNGYEDTYEKEYPTFRYVNSNA